MISETRTVGQTKVKLWFKRGFDHNVGDADDGQTMVKLWFDQAFGDSDGGQTVVKPSGLTMFDHDY